MGFSIGGAVNSASEWAGNSLVLGRVISNPVLTALLLTALASVVYYALYRETSPRAGGNRMMFKAIAYTFLLQLLVISLYHYSALRREQEGGAAQGIRNVFSGIEASQAINGLAMPQDIGAAPRDITGGVAPQEWASPQDTTGGVAPAPYASRAVETRGYPEGLAGYSGGEGIKVVQLNYRQ